MVRRRRGGDPPAGRRGVQDVEEAADDPLGIPEGWVSRETWRREVRYHPCERLDAFLRNLVVNHHCEVDMTTEEAVYLVCGCAQGHLRAIRTESLDPANFPDRIMTEIRATFSCCFK